MTYGLLFLVVMLTLLLFIAVRFITRNELSRDNLEAKLIALERCAARIDRALHHGPEPVKLSATKLAAKYNSSPTVIQERLERLGYIEMRSGLHYFTALGLRVGGEYRKNHPEASDSDGHMVWPVDIPLSNAHWMFIQNKGDFV